MIVFQFTYNSSGKYAITNDNVFGTAWLYNTEAEMLNHVNQTLNYKIDKSGANFILKGKAGLNYLSAITQSGNNITAISWSTNPNSAVTTNSINTAINIAQAISDNF